MPNATFQAAATAIRNEFARKMPETRQTIKQLWTHLCHVNWDTQTLSKLLHETHKLAGSGTTFGFPAITEHARGIENQLVAIEQNGGDANADQRAVLDDDIQRLLAVMHQSQSTTPPLPHTTELHPSKESAKAAVVAIIEDDRLQATHMQALLTDWGFRSQIFESPDTFTQAAYDKDFGLILLDISFPNKSQGGIAWLEQLPTKTAKKVPIVITSARTDIVARIRALRCGASAYITKPIDPSELKKIVETMTAHGEAHRDKVLVVDDDILLTRHYCAVLKKAGFAAQAINNPLSVLNAINEFKPDLLLLDFHMPGCNGIELARLLSLDPKYQHIPILFASGHAEAFEGNKVQLQVGNDFLQKPVDDDRLIRHIQRLLAQAKYIQQQIAITSTRLSSDLLYNRSYFFSELETLLSEIKTGQLSGNRHIMLYATASNSEYLNQKYDKVRISDLHRQVEHSLARHPDIKGHGCAMGDLHYALLLRTGSNEASADLINRVARSIADETFNVENQAVSLSLTLGAVQLTPQSGSVNKVLETAEAACASALKKGVNSQIAANLDETATPAQKVQKLLEKALSDQSYQLQFQSIVQLETHDPFFETTVRLLDEEGDIYPPAQFMPIIQKRGDDSLLALDRWIIEHAIQRLASLKGKQAPAAKIIIKLSPVVASLEKIGTFVGNLVRSSRLRGGRRVYLSLPENFVVRHTQPVSGLIKTLHLYDCGFMINNVSINTQLKQLLTDLPPIDAIKLDSQWSSDLIKQGEHLARLKELGTIPEASFQIIAGFVEDAKTIALLWEAGVRWFQGYFIGQPDALMDLSESETSLA